MKRIIALISLAALSFLQAEDLGCKEAPKGFLQEFDKSTVIIPCSSPNSNIDEVEKVKSENIFDTKQEEKSENKKQE